MYMAYLVHVVIKIVILKAKSESLDIYVHFEGRIALCNYLYRVVKWILGCY